ncbi:MAG: hypothetical protein Q8J78_05350, partial [Moraxellaceae bacterium]|nr:hypothetical protein [Moraxellaceae bacterium]
ETALAAPVGFGLLALGGLYVAANSGNEATREAAQGLIDRGLDAMSGLVQAAGAVNGIGASTTSSERTISQPPKPNRGVTCTCRAASNGLQDGNCPDEEYAFGTATAPTKRAARAEAERIARRNLGKQAKHTQCKCTDAKGNPVY